jgi:hypothetical protein
MDFGASSSDVPLALLKGLLGLVAIVGTLVKYAKGAADKRLAEAAKVPASDVPPVLPPQRHVSPFPSSEITGRFLEAHTAVVMRAERALADAKTELEQCRRERDDVAADARRTAALLVRAETEERSAKAKLATLEAAVEHWRSEAARHEREAERLRARQRTERVDPETIATPMRPPRRTP